MKIKVLKLMVFTLMFSLFVQPPIICMASSNFSAEQAYEHMKQISQKIGPRPAGSENEIKAAQYIYYILEKNGWKVKQQPFSKIVVKNPSAIMKREYKVEMIQSQNIIAELPGNSPETVVIGAHYDTANTTTPGAVDNSSGVGVLLELARVLASEKHDLTYQLVFFGAEENGLVGSSYFVAQSDLSAVNWMLNLDMMGTPIELDGAGTISTHPQLIKKIAEVVRKHNISYKLSRDNMVMTRESAQGGSSDHSPFLDQGIPAISLGIADKPYGYYHRAEDSIELLTLAEIQKVGVLVYDLVKSVRLEQTGQRTWDEHYLTFKIGGKVFIVSSFYLRLFIFFSFCFAGAMLWQVLKTTPRLGWRHYTWTGLFIFAISILNFITSGIGELFWSWVKDVKYPWQAYPQVFLLIRICICMLLFLACANFFKKLPISREPKAPWLLSITILGVISVFLALLRVDLAFPFIFWLVCLTLQWKLPNPVLAIIGPFFLFYWHWDLLHSQQWFSFYTTFYRYPLLFFIIYGFGLSVIMLSLWHVINTQSPIPWFKIIKKMQIPAFVCVLVLILVLGLFPPYTKEHPQLITVKEEWIDNENSKVNISSQDRLPLSILKQMPQNLTAAKNSVTIPTLAVQKPMEIEMRVGERSGDLRVVDAGLTLKYDKEPYLFRIHLESNGPFEIIEIDEFLPADKLPKKVQLKGQYNDRGTYSLILERTSPQRKLINLSIAAQNNVTCVVEGLFADVQPDLIIKQPNVSVEYEVVVKKKFNF